jgi:hypothetical protein
LAHRCIAIATLRHQRLVIGENDSNPAPAAPIRRIARVHRDRCTPTFDLC